MMYKEKENAIYTCDFTYIIIRVDISTTANGENFKIRHLKFKFKKKTLIK